ncbi:ribonuclease H-like domain-containing protein [Halomarina oriensis]|uniref:Exonuclease n=1 Tax=Halomarina oriensis TaxID=671145 RepID=A0A6B0GVI0_9EURY|nr:exonuclease [Halomarina oriensis]
MRIENSFIPVQGVGETTERRLWEQGITHWDEFERDAVGEVTGERIASFIDEGRDHLASGNAQFFDAAFPSQHRWRLYEDFREGACFFDIETTGLSHHRDQVTTVSLLHDGEVRTLVNDPDPVVGEPLTRETLREALDAPLLVTFNGTTFDVPFLETSYDLDLDVPHLDLRYACGRVGLSGGLKAIEKDVGIERDRPDISGRDAVRLWHEYEGGSEDSLETLVSYNRDDAVNLRTLMDDLSRTLHDDATDGLL